jgi:hypothetical protein
MTLAAWSVVVGTVVVLGIVALLMARQGSPGALSEQYGRPSRQAHVVDRPADAGAETMDLPASPGAGASPAAGGTEPATDPEGRA